MIEFIRQLSRRSPYFVNGRTLGVAAAFAGKVTGAGLAFLFSVMLARLLGSAGTGVYFLALTIVSIGAAIARLGLDNAVLRFASIAYDQGDRSTLAALYRQGMGLVLVAGVVTALLVWLGTPYLPLGGDRSSELHVVLPVMSLALIPTALIMLQGEFFKATGAPGIATIVQAVVLPMFLVMGAAVLFGQGSTTVNDIVFLYVIAATVSVLLVGVIWDRYKPGLWKEQGCFDTRLLLRTSLPLLWAGSMNMVMSWTDVLVLGVWTDPATVGVYGVATRVATLTAFVLIAVNSVIVPQFSALHAQKNYRALEQLAQRSAGWMLLAISPIIIFLMLFPQLILQLFGADFVAGVSLLRILAFGQLVNVAIGSVGYLLIMTGHERLMRNAIMMSAVLNLVGNLFLVPAFGAMGAALSTTFSLVTMNLLFFYLVYKKLGINTMGYLFRRSGSCSRR